MSPSPPLVRVRVQPDAVVPGPQDPAAAADRRPVRPRGHSRRSLAQHVRLAASVVVWLGVVALVASQLVCLFFDSQTSVLEMLYGRDPRTGAYVIEGANDDPFSDRSIACVQQGRQYQPMQLSALLARAPVLDDTAGPAIAGYRVIRREEIAFRDEVRGVYATKCNAIAGTLDRMLDACATLGYNVTRDALRIVEDLGSNVTRLLPRALPVLLLPYWDNAIYSRYAIPGWDGSACVFRLTGIYDSATETKAWLYAVNRTVREGRTREWLGLDETTTRWRNGWLEDPSTGRRWYSDLLSTQPEDDYGMRARFFDLLNGTEVDCWRQEAACRPTAVPEWWGNRFSCTGEEQWMHSVAISDGTRLGLFLYQALQHRTVRIIYDVAMFISNTTIAVLLARWCVCMLALHRGHRRGLARFHTAGIGSLACTRNFELLPLLLLPRLRNAFAAFFSAGCRFEGEQMPFAESWFSIYPGIAEVMVFYFSVLNLVAKLLRRRMSDALFGPSLFLLCLLHYLRGFLAMSGWLEFDGRLTTVMTATEFDRLQFYDFFISDAGYRLNGKVPSLFSFKLALLGLNLLPLVLSTKVDLAMDDERQDPKAPGGSTFVRATKAHANSSPGLGQALGGAVAPPHRRVHCSAYEVARLGYVVYGETFLITISDWLLLLVLHPLRSYRRVSTFRILAFEVCECDCAPPHADSGGRAFHVRCGTPRLLQLNDPRLLRLPLSNVIAVPLH